MGFCNSSSAHLPSRRASSTKWPRFPDDASIWTLFIVGSVYAILVLTGIKEGSCFIEIAYVCRAESKKVLLAHASMRHLRGAGGQLDRLVDSRQLEVQYDRPMLNSASNTPCPE